MLLLLLFINTLDMLTWLQLYNIFHTAFLKSIFILIFYENAFKQTVVNAPNKQTNIIKSSRWFKDATDCVKLKSLRQYH